MVDGMSKQYKYTDDEAVFKCNDCDGWHFHDEALEERGLTQEMMLEALERMEKDGKSSES